MLLFNSKALLSQGKPRRCRCELLYVPKFTAASRAAIHATARLLYSKINDIIMRKRIRVRHIFVDPSCMIMPKMNIKTNPTKCM